MVKTVMRVNERPPYPISACWQRSEQLGFAIDLKEKRLIEQFLRYEGIAEDGSHSFRFFWKTYRGNIGGGAAVESGAVLHTDDAYRPLDYEIFSDRETVQSISLREQEAIIRRTDGSVFQIPLRAPIGLVLHENIVLQIAVLLPMLRGVSRFTVGFFSPLTLSCHELVLQRLERKAWDTNLGIALHCDANGRLQSLSGGDGAVRGTRLDEAFPSVDWAELRQPKAKPYRPPESVRIRDIVIDGPVALTGALSLPRTGRAPYPAFVFLQGSGRHDRHGISPALDTGVHEIIDGLSSSGYAGLRFDSRGIGSSGFGDPFESGIDARLEDARAALRILATCEEVDRDNLFLIGHSLGALIAMELSIEAEEALRGLVLLAPPGRRIDHIIIEQACRELIRLGFSESEMKRRRDQLRRLFRAMSNAKADQAPDNTWGLSRLAIRDLMRLKPMDLVRKVRAPLLICQGAKDIQISPERDAIPLFLAAAESNLSAQLVMLSDSDHLFRHETEASPSPARYFTPRPLASALLAVLLEWLQRHCVPR
jgi:pimeloyl-ACP methyl ester carboxylesterase